MDLIEFKTQIFDGSLKPTEIAVVLFIALQDRSKYVFYKTVMMHALGIKDIRTLNNVIQKLIDKKIIKQTITRARGFLFSIIGLDEDNAHDAEQEEKGSNVMAEREAAGKEKKETERPQDAAAPVALDTVPDAETSEGSAGSAVNDYSENGRKVPAGRDIKNKFTDLTDLSEMPEEQRAALADIMRGFA